MKCAKCSEETNEGSTYGFYYGYSKGEIKSRNHKLITAFYSVSQDLREVFLCHRCVDQFIEHRARIFAIVGFFVMLFIILSFVTYGGNNLSVLEAGIVFLIALIVGVILFFAILSGKKEPKQREDEGDRLAIKIHKSELMRQGFDSFFIRSERPYKF